MDDEDTHRIDLGSADTDRGLVAVLAHDDTDEWDDTDRDIEAQGTLDEPAGVFEDTSVVIVNRPHASEDFAVSFRRAPTPRAVTEAAWPPAPREPAPISERAFRRARVYRVVNLVDTTNEKTN